MSFARDKLYSGYLRRNMPTIVSKVKVREILPHLPCLTDHDRENIEAKRETYGNFDSMMLLLDCLKRRENWPEQFIAALEACEHPTIAAEIRAQYEALKGNSHESANSTPSSPQTTVVRAHVHPAPSAIQPPVPESSGNNQAAVSPPAVASAPPEPAVQPSPPPRVPVQPETPPMPAIHIPEEVPPPEPVVEPPKEAQIEVAPPPSTPPPSPATPHLPAAGSPSPLSFHPEPEENSESDIQDFPADNGVVSAEVSAGKEDESIGGAAEIPPQSGPVEQSEGGAPACSDFLQTTATAAEVSPPRSPSPAENDSDMLADAAVITMTPEKPPVQDTTPPAAALEPEETTKPQTAQAVESSPQRETTATVSPLPAAAAAAADEMDAPRSDDSSGELLSKPGVLISVQPQNHDDSPTIHAPSLPVEPYSGDTGRLEISEAAPDTETLNPAPACSAASSAAINSVATEPCMENGFANNHNEPEENHYDSPSQSLETQEILENVGQVYEEPSILNLDGLNLTPQAQTVNGEAAKEIRSSPPAPAEPTETVTDVNTPIREECNSSTEPEPAGLSTELNTVKDSQEEKPSRMLQVNTKYIVAAAGVGAFALLMAWKFKN